MIARFKAARSFLRFISWRSVSLLAGCDFVVQLNAGHGVSEPEHVKAPQPDGLGRLTRRPPRATNSASSAPMVAGSRDKWIPVPPK
jgi:hypothetical protein